MNSIISIESESYDFNKQLNNLCSTVNINLDLNYYVNMNNIKESILTKCYSISDSLESYHIIPQEFFDFLRISDMVEEIFTNDENFNINNLLFLNIVVGNFIDIMKERFKLTKGNTLKNKDISMNDFKNYERKFDKYHKKFMEFYEEFECNIFPPNTNEDDAVKVIYKLIGNSYFKDKL